MSKVRRVNGRSQSPHEPGAPQQLQQSQIEYSNTSSQYEYESEVEVQESQSQEQEDYNVVQNLSMF